MGEVDTASPPDIIITDQDERTVSYLQPHVEQKKRGSQVSNGSLPHSMENGSLPGHSPPEQNTYLALRSTRHGSNGSAHILSTDKDKPLDTTVNIETQKHAKEKEAEAEQTTKQTRFPKFSLRAAFSHRNKKKKCLSVTKRSISSPFGVLCLIIVYLSLGACVFMALERPEESRRRTELIRQRYELTDRLTNCSVTEKDPTECLLKEIKQWEQHLVLKYPVLYIHLGDNNSSEPQVWNWPNAFYGCFSVITTIGYGTIAPITIWGRLIVIVYAIVGIPLMLLLVADIGSQLARVVKIIIIAIRKRREKGHFWKYKPKKRPDDKPQTSSPEHDTSELKGHSNQGLEMNEDDGGTAHARVAHLNGVNLHLEVTHNDDSSDSSYSSCSNNDESGKRNVRRRKRKLMKRKMRDSKRRNSDFNRENEKVNNDKNSHGITIQIDCDESSDVNDNSLEDQHSSHMYDVLRLDQEKGHDSDFKGLPTLHKDHQIKEYDSISPQFRDDREIKQFNFPQSIMLEVPRLGGGGGGSHTTNDTGFVTDDGISSITSSLPPTPSNVPRNVPNTAVSKSVGRKESDFQIENKTRFALQNGDYSDSGQSQSAPNSPALMRPRKLDRRPSSVSINLACLDSFQSQNIEPPSGYNGRPMRRRRRPVKFGAALGSFSSVSENDIAVFSFPLWLALLLLFIYLLIGAICYSFMEGWHIIDSFYYAFISLSTIGFGDLYFVPETFEGALIFNFVYCFIGLSFVSMVWGLSSREFTLLARKIGRKFGYYKSRRWRRTFKGWSDRMRERSVRRWSSRRRNAMKVQDPQNDDTTDKNNYSSDQQKNDRASHSERDCSPSELSHDE